MRVPLRIARRSIRRNLARSLLIAVLVALPVAAATMVDVLARTMSAPERDAAQAMGTADARATVSGWSRLEGFQPAPWWSDPQGEGKPARDPATVELAALLPPGSRAVRAPLRYDLVAKAGERTLRTPALVADVGEPLHAFEATLVEGRPPGDDEVALSPALAERLGVRVGATIEAADRPVTVTAIAEQAFCLRCPQLVAAPGSSVAATAARGVPWNGNPGGIDYLVDLPDGASPTALWPELAEHGIALTPRDAYLHPERYGESDAGTPISVDELRTAAMTTLIAGLGLLEVVLLAGTAFAVGARRQTRELGLVAASGGSARHIRRIVLAQGLVLGALGAVLGVAAGFALAFAGQPLWERLNDGRILTWAFGPWEIAGAALIGLVSGLAAAVVPAIGAARMRPVDALAERFRVMRGARRAGAAVGGLFVAAGAVLGIAGDRLLADDFAAYARAVATAAETGEYVAAPAPAGPVALIVAGATLLVVGLVILTPAAIGSLAAAAARLPLSPRLAVRDAARHRHRTGPATSAIAIAVAGSVVVAFLIAGNLRADELKYVPSTPPNVLVIDPGEADADAMATAAARAADLLPGARLLEVRQPARPARPGEPEAAAAPFSGREIFFSPGHTGCANGCLDGGVAIAGDEALDDLVAGGRLDPAARRALADGRVVVFRPELYRDGYAVVDEQIDAERNRVAPRVRLPAHLATRELAYPALPSALLPESVVRERGWERAPIRTYVRYDASATRDQLDAAVAAADRVGAYAEVEDGPDRSSHGMLLILAAVAGLVALIGVAISVALSAAEGRADLATLAAVGAPPRRRRALAAAQALLVAGLGCGLGVAFGAFVAFTARATTGAPGFVVPWSNLALTLLVVPIVATAVGALLVPSRLPLMRRAT